MRFGNLENLNLGMGLKATESQFVPAKYASLDGWSQFAETGPSKKTTISIFGTLLLLVLVYKLMR
jgi:hypothetical protein